MSVVVAIKDKDKFYLGADTQITLGDMKETLLNDNSQKI